ncbi:SGNH/GDSL hydrolase family protein [Mesorhizobium sp.]|uniref:SGNH/GDSL hydrolase family protein n=1 Tax=Mesorhizobium sp. TaxID=1871066 RepID=UPI0012175E18|nr:GDSL-type esterase/lipase family protein [Mesorhizobium sp.]TIP07791.1 MAG: hypothetical protein E5X73_35190 [Mesorhizobium sp.]
MANEIRDAFNAVYADGPVGSPSEPQKSDIRSQIGAVIQTTVDGLDSRLAAAESTIDPLPGQITDLGERVDTVEALALSGVKPAKQSVRLLVTTDVVLASALENGDTLDGLTLATGDRVALVGQTTESQNGVYVVPASGAAARAGDMDTADELVGARFDVDAGTHAAETWALQTPAPITVGTTALVFVKTTSASALSGAVADLDARVDLSDTKVDALAQIEGLGIPTAKLTENAGSVTPYIYRAYTVANATTYELVVVAKAGERSKLQMFCNAAGAGFTANFDLVDGTSSGSGANFVSTSMEHIGGGWYECKTVFLTTATPSAQLQVRFSAAGTFPYTGDGTSGVYVRSVALQIQSTTTNLLPSNDPVNAAFTKVGCAAANTTSPETPVLTPLAALTDSIDVIVNGRMTADKIIEPSGSGSPSVYQSKTFALDDVVVFKVIAKAGERTRLNLFSQSPIAFDCTFDLANGTSSGAGSSILALGNGWYECTVTKVATGAGSVNVQHRMYGASGGHPYVGDGVSGLFLQQSTLTKNGGENLFTFSTDYSSASWTKAAGVTVSANSGLYLGLLSDPDNLGSNYDDGRAALVGKKWAALGSSITAQAQYTAPLASSTGMVLTNLGVSGASLGAASGGGSGGLGIFNAIASIPADTEIVTLESGINDYAVAEVTLGALNDTTTATFYGALFAAVTAIRAQAPSAKIVFITPYSGGSGHATHKILRANGLGKYLNEYQQAVRDVAKLTGYPCIDIAGKSGIGYFTGALYMSDNLHINATGGARYSNCALDDLRMLSRAGFFGT